MWIWILLGIAIVVMIVGFVCLSNSKWWMGHESIITLIKCHSCGEERNFSPLQGKCDECLRETE